MLEIKHIVRQLLIMRNRGQATAMPYENEPLVLAKASVSPAIRFKAGITAAERKALENDYMIQLYLGRTPETKTMNRPFVSVRAQYVAGLDFIRQSREVRLNLEFDFKNRPVAPYMAMVQGQPHIAFKTVPWQTVDEAQRARVIFDQWRRRHCLKDLTDWQDWIEFYRFTVACDANRKKGVSRGINVSVLPKPS